MPKHGQLIVVHPKKSVNTIRYGLYIFSRIPRGRQRWQSAQVRPLLDAVGQFFDFPTTWASLILGFCVMGMTSFIGRWTASLLLFLARIYLSLYFVSILPHTTASS